MPETIPSWPPPLGVISMTYARPFTREHLGLFASMKRAGMAFCELLVPEPGELDPAEAGRAARDAGLFLVLAARVNAQRDLASAEPAIRRAGVDYLRTCVETAVACGADLVGGPLYGAPLVFAGRAPAVVTDAERQDKLARVLDGLREAAPFAASHGVRLAIEPLNRFETDLCNTAGHAAWFADQVASPAVGVMLDTFHMNMEEDDMPQAIAATARHLIHFQANENHRGFVGTGHVPWAPICQALRAASYGGSITLEPFRRTDPPPGTPLAQWRPPEKDQTPDLAESAARLTRHLVGG